MRFSKGGSHAQIWFANPIQRSKACRVSLSDIEYVQGTSAMHETPSAPIEHSAIRQIAEDHYYSAVDHIAEGDLTAAIAAFRASLASDPSFYDAWHGLIRVLQDAGHLGEAIVEANRLEEKDPEDVLVHTRLSILYQMKGMIPEAEAEAAKARILGWKHELKNKPVRAAGFQQ